MKRILCAFALFVLTFLFSLGSLVALETGEPAPEFTLTDIQGQPHSLSDFHGKHVVLEWINHECPFVVKHYESGNMQSLQTFAAENDTVWLSINSSAPGLQGNYPAEEWLELTESKNAKPAAVLLDEDGSVGRMYGAQTTPHMYVINPDGILIYQGAIDSIPSTDIEDIAEAENYVKRALNASYSGEPITTSSAKAYGCSVKYAR